MSNYTKTTDFEAKDSLPTGDSGKIIRGAEFETEFDAIATAIATKADTAGPTFTGTLTFETISDGSISVTAFVDEDDMVSDSATLVPTQQSVKAYVDSVTTELQAQDLDFQADSGGALSIDLDTETMTFTGGTGIDTSGSVNTVTFAIDSTVTTLTGTQTLTNKTLTAPVISTISNTGTITLPTSTDTLVGRATTDTLTNKTLTSAVLDTGVSGTAVLDEDDMVSNSATQLATQQSIKAYVDSQVAGADTLAEVLGNGNTTGGTDLSVSSGDDIIFADSSKAIFGADSDLQIYHDGSNSYIVENGTGGLYIKGANTFQLQDTSDKKYFQGVSGAWAKLYYNDAEKLATTSTGIDVTGTVTADGLTVEGSSVGGTYITSSSGSAAGDVKIEHIINASRNLNTINSESGSGSAIALALATGETERLNIASNGDISFYEDTGTTAKFFWDASDEALRIGGTSNVGVSEAFTVYGDSSNSNYPLTSVFADTSAYDASAPVAGGGLGFAFKYNTGGSYAVGSLITGIKENATDGNYASALTFRTRANGANPVEQMRITSAGDVGIGTSSPAKTLHISAGVNASPTTFRIENTDTSIDTGQEANAIEFYTNDASTDGTGVSAKIAQVADNPGSQYDLAFSTYNTALAEAMRITNEGNVGIGTSSPDTLLHLSDTAGGAVIRLERNDTSIVSTDVYGEIQFEGQDASAGSAAGIRGKILGVAEGATGEMALAFQTASGYSSSTERMRIDSSGNLLVGTTNTTHYATSTTSGHTLFANGVSTHSADGGTVGIFNRRTSDGSIVDFRKDGTTVGSIASVGGNRIAIGTDDVGLFFDSVGDELEPWSMTAGSVRDAAINIGRSGGRFKDLYLSGGVYVGGTGSANHLDDYEEGTFTPEFADAISAGNTASVTTLKGRYTKVGDVVHIYILANGITTTGMTGVNDLIIRNLPFVNKNDNDYPQFNYKSENVGFDSSAHLSPQLWTNTSYIKICEAFNTGGEDFITVNQITSGTGIIVISGFYFAA